MAPSRLGSCFFILVLPSGPVQAQPARRSGWQIFYWPLFGASRSIASNSGWTPRKRAPYPWPTKEVPGESAWQLLELVKARRINLAGQSGGNPVVNGQESKEPSQCADVVLQTWPVQAFAGFGDIGFDLRDPDLLQRDLLSV